MINDHDADSCVLTSGERQKHLFFLQLGLSFVDHLHLRDPNADRAGCSIVCAAVCQQTDLLGNQIANFSSSVLLSFQKCLVEGYDGVSGAK